MCGIVGCVLRGGEAAPILLDSLKRLEYRGYDSVGQATICNGRIEVRKDKGRIGEVDEVIHLGKMMGRLGIGHTRWATHGAPSLENAHPHVDCENQVAVIHNGIVENFMELKKSLEDSGHKFTSRTDTEVIPHLLEEFMGQGESFEEAFRKTAQKLKGSYAIVAISSKEPDKVICGKKENPLLIGVSNDAAYCASDVPAFLPYTNTAVELGEGEMAILKPGSVRLLSIETAEHVERQPFKIEWTAETAEKLGYDHFMLKEIHEQPSAIRNALRTQSIYHELMANILDQASRVFLVACGTSHHACLAAAYALAKLGHLPAEAMVASEFSEWYGKVIDHDTAVLGISQSGETADTLNAVRIAKEFGASVISITNVMGSTITRFSDVYIGQNSGPEIGVAASKTFTAQVAVLMKLALTLGRRRHLMDEFEFDELMDHLNHIPELMQHVIETKDREVRTLAEKYARSKSFCFLGRGINVTTAFEGRLKLMELSYIPSIAYPAGESKHGSIAVIEEGFPVIFVAPRDETHHKTLSNMMEMKARGAAVIALVEEGDDEAKDIADECIEMPAGVPSLLTPLLYVIPLQLFAYYVAVERRCDPDKPRNLAKSVTVE